MKQVLQDLASGNTLVADVPRPQCRAGHILVASSCSLISVGTERSLVSFSRAGYLDKARQQPEKVREVLNKIRTDGLIATVDAVMSKLDQPMPMGYSNVGRVIEVGDGVEGFSIGDRVVSNGPHAEVVCVPKNLCARIPDAVSDEDAAYTVLGAIALQGLRNGEPEFGDTVAVIGLGLVGFLCAQFARANGCRVIGFDLDPARVEAAQKMGFEAVVSPDTDQAVARTQSFTSGNGADIVLVAAASQSSAPMVMGAEMCRDRGRLIQVGATGLDMPRPPLFDKELMLRVSRSYGPGRYDPGYEGEGRDYPYGYVRWTEQRNFTAVLEALATGQVSLAGFEAERFDIADAGKAYDLVINGTNALGIFIDYGAAEDGDDTPKSTLAPTLVLTPEGAPAPDSVPAIAAIGAGNYAGRVLLPAFKATGARLKTIVTSQGVSGSHYGKKLGFEVNTTDKDVAFGDDDISSVVIATRHDSHAGLVCRALKEGKSAFVEKPLALTHDELDAIEQAYADALARGDHPRLMVGFNRRFSSLATALKSHLTAGEQPLSLVYTCNAGHIPAKSWVQDIKQGGGRIVGEACHFIDMARYVTGASITSVSANFLGTSECGDTASINLGFENGSIAAIHYFANGHKSFPKERMEVFQRGRVMVLDNFRKLTGFGVERLGKKSLWRQDKGQAACAAAFIDALRDGSESPIPFAELMEVSRASVDAAAQFRKQ